MFSFIKNRPPLIVFFLCLLTCAIALFCFAFYVKNTEPIPDSDRNNDWVALLKHFNSLDTCLELNQSSLKEVSEHDFIEMTTVQTLASINNTDFIKKFNSVKGFLTLEGWHTNCPKSYYDKPSQLQIYFYIPEVAKTNVTEFDTCVSIRGPEEYLPKFSKLNCEMSGKGDEKKLELHLSTNVRAKRDEFCNDGVFTKMKFYPQKKENVANYLDDKEKSIIYVHLLWTSYFLLFVLLIIVAYGILQNEQVFDRYIQKFAPHN